MSSRVPARPPSPRPTPIGRRTVVLSGLALLAAGSGRPLVLFGEQDLAPQEVSTWADFWKKQHGPKLELKLRGSKHATFTDFAPLLPQAAPLLHRPHSYVVEGIGTIDGDRAVAVERAFINAWFDTYLRHQNSLLLAGPSSRYPEVQFVR